MPLEQDSLDGAFGYRATRIAASTWNANRTVNTDAYKKDWKGLYIARSADVAKGYLPDMTDDQGNGAAFVNRVAALKPIPVIRSLDPGFQTGTPDTVALRKEIAALGIVIPDDEGIVPALAARGYAFECYHDDEKNFEIIIGSALVAAIQMSDFESCTIKKYASTCTSI